MFSLFQRAKVAYAIQLDGAEPFTANSGQTVLEAALASSIQLPFRCRVGICGTCRCRLLSGQVKQRTDAAYVLSKQEIDEGFILACQSEPREDLRICLPE